MEAEINIQLDLFQCISKAQVNFKKSPKERITVPYLETRLESLEKLWAQFSVTHQRIIEGNSAAELAQSVYTTKGIYDATDDRYLDYKCELKTALSKFTASKASSSNTSSLSSKSSQVKLPKITIPTFSGQYTEWMSFRDLFVSLIHDNTDIDNVQKLHYLKGHLKGEAEQLLRHVPITNSSYEQCWTLLKNRYNNKQYLVNCIFQRFFSQKNILLESSNAIRELLDLTTETLNALQGLGIDTDSWDTIIIYIGSQRLDRESRKQWEAKVSELSSLSNTLPTMYQFKEFLETKYHSLEFLDNKSTAYVQKQNTFTHNVKYNQFNSIQTLHVTQVSCVSCKGDHHLRNCKQFVNMDINSKRNFVQDHGLCFNCLGSNHSVKHCRNSTSCQICNRRHHSLLHPKGEIQSIGSGESVGNQDASSSLVGQVYPSTSSPETIETKPLANITSHFAKGVARDVLLATAVVKAESRNGEHQLIRALIDQGSQASFITTAAVQLLGLKTIPTRGFISGLGGEQNLISKAIAELTISSRLNPGCVLQVSAYVLDELTAYLPANVVGTTSWPELDQITLADPEYHTPNKIDVLLGAEVYSSIIDNGVIKCPSGSLIAQNTTLGWILSGKIQSEDKVAGKVISMHAHVEDVNQQLKAFWEIGTEPSNTQKLGAVEKQRCEAKYHTTTTRDEEGRNVIRLQFRDEQPACADGQSKVIALKGFHFLERNLLKKQHLKQEYDSTFNECLQLNHWQRLKHTGEKKLPRGLYLPYHAAIQEDRETTKVRIVFDASCKGVNGVSLNNGLMVGLTLQPESRHIAMCWRMHPIGFIAEIVKMYDEDLEYQRLPWHENPDEDIKECKLLRVTLGTSSAPYLTVKSLVQVAIDEGQHFILEVEKVKRVNYMTDWKPGYEEHAEEIIIYIRIMDLLRRRGIKMQKQSINCEEKLEAIKENTVKQKGDQRTDIKQDVINRIIGLTWSSDVVHEEFVHSVQLPPRSDLVAKGKVKVKLDITMLYDLREWITSDITTATIFIQKLWIAGADCNVDRSERNHDVYASRSITSAELIRHDLWENGSEWLREENVIYNNPKNLSTELEERKVVTYLAAAVPEVEVEDDAMWSKYSLLTKLLRIVAYFRRLLKNKNHTYLLKTEINKALVLMVKGCQQNAFKELQLQKKGLLTSLDPQMDETGVVRDGGRFKCALIDEINRTAEPQIRDIHSKLVEELDLPPAR